MCPASKTIWLTSIGDSHGSWANSIRDHWTELLLRLRRMHDVLCRDSILFLPVSLLLLPVLIPDIPNY